MFDIEPQTAISKDNAPVTVDMLVFMRVVNPEASVLDVRSYRTAACGMAVTTLRAVVVDASQRRVHAKGVPVILGKLFGLVFSARVGWRKAQSDAYFREAEYAVKVLSGLRTRSE